MIFFFQHFDLTSRIGTAVSYKYNMSNSIIVVRRRVSDRRINNTQKYYIPSLQSRVRSRLIVSDSDDSHSPILSISVRNRQLLFSFIIINISSCTWEFITCICSAHNIISWQYTQNWSHTYQTDVGRDTCFACRVREY